MTYGIALKVSFEEMIFTIILTCKTAIATPIASRK